MSCPICSQPVTPGPPNKRFCSRRCMHRASARRRRALALMGPHPAPDPAMIPAIHAEMEAALRDLQND